MSGSSKAYIVRYRLDRMRGVDRSPVAASPVLEHVQRLLAAGATRRNIAEAAGVSPAAVSRLLLGRQSTVQRGTARKLLAAKVLTDRCAPEAFVPRLGSRRRLEALLALGWRHEDLHAASGLRTGLILSQAGDLLSARTAARVRDLYARLSMSLGPSAQTRARAARAGYAPPMAWDDEDLDDPAAQPQGVRTATAQREGRYRASSAPVDPVAVHRAATGEPVPLTAAERAAAVHALTEQGLSALLIAERLHLTERSVQRLRSGRAS